MQTQNVTHGKMQSESSLREAFHSKIHHGFCFYFTFKYPEWQVSY
jgi:hypothetical protein